MTVGARYHHGQLRQAILDASRDILAESGARGLSLREAARRAGVSSAAPYRHFKDKESLLVALAQAAFGRLDAELAGVAEAHTGASPLLRVQKLGVAYVEFAAKYPAEFRLMFGELAPPPESSDELAAATASASAHLPRALSELASTIGPESPPVEDLTLLAWSVVHGLATLHLDGHLRHFEGKDAPAVAERITAMLTRALQGAWSSAS
jgi:AcrR family transcriptional regulator